jgi:histidinol dehydrogenase
MAFGTATVPRVYKIFGPGNQFVTRAKQIVSEEGVAIDMPAGPSELLVIADEFAEPSFIAADLLSQAEHGEDSQVVLVVNEKVDIVRVQREISEQLRQLPRMAIAEKALANSRIVTFSSEERAMDFVNAYAPEHLIINTKNAGILAEKVVNAGSVFLGGFSPESAGDYASGTNHTLPTNGYARAYAGVSLESFLKYITFQEISADGLKLLGPVVEKMAEAELLEGHKMAVRRRLEYLKTN